MEKKKKVDEALHAEKAQTTFEAKVNKYGFLHFGKAIMKAWNLSKGTEQPVTIELTPDDVLTIRKA